MEEVFGHLKLLCPGPCVRLVLWPLASTSLKPQEIGLRVYSEAVTSLSEVSLALSLSCLSLPATTAVLCSSNMEPFPDCYVTVPVIRGPTPNFDSKLLLMAYKL